MDQNETPAREDDQELRVIEDATLELPYVPDFLLDEVQYWFAPSLEEATAVYHELTGQAASTWQSYYTKKGWQFIHSAPRTAEGPFRIRPEGREIRILDPGKIFSPKPLFHIAHRKKGIPIVSLEKRRPINPWKPNYIQAVNFIRGYEWPHALPRSVHHAIWEIEECGQVAGSISWKNGEAILGRHPTREVRETISDVFYNRPEDYPLGSEVYLRVLGMAGEEGYGDLLKLADHPVSRKRRVVANTLGQLGNPAGIETLLKLIEDEDPDVRTAALRALGKVGVTAKVDPEGKVAAYLESPEIPKQVWASQAILKGGDISQEKFLIALVKEQPRLLTDMGELGEVLADLGLVEAVPFCINRLKHEKPEFRADAAESLSRITGIDIEYQALDSAEQRRTAIKTYSRWWEQKKRERRTGRGK